MNRAAAGPPERSGIEDAASLPMSDSAAAADLRATVRGVEILVFRDLAAAAAAWGGFVRTADCTVFQTFGYLSAWQRDIGAREGSEPLVVFGRRPDGTTSFLLPFARDHWRGLGRLRWLGQDQSDYTGPILATDFSDRGELGSFVEVWKGILRLLASIAETRVEIIDLRKMPDHVGRQFNPFCYLEVDVHPAGAHYAEVGRDWDTYYKARRSSSTRSRDRSKVKRLSSQGVVDVVTPDTDDEIVRTIDIMFEQKAAFFARGGIPDPFALPGRRDFYVDLATNARTRQLVHVARLEVGGVVAATNLGLRFRQRYYYVIAAYDPGDLHRFGPGAVHLRALIERAIGQGNTVFDFTIGDEPYKLDWCNVSIKLYDHLAAARPVGWPVVAGLRGLLAAKRTIKGDPRLWALAQKVRAWTGRGAAPAAPKEEAE